MLSRVRVTLVDNSCDASYAKSVQNLLSEMNESDFSRLSYLGQAQNRGFGAGHNAVLDSLDSDVHLILNPDVELEEGALRAGLGRLSREDGLALVSPRVAGEDGGQEFLCKRYPTVFVLLLRAFAPAFVQSLFRDRLDRYQMTDLCSGEAPAEVPLASGCFMLVPTRSLQAVGGFNERYFLYFEDFDLSLRLQRLGRLLFDPDVRIVHYGGYAARKGLRHVGYFVRSGIRFFNDHGWRWI